MLSYESAFLEKVDYGTTTYQDFQGGGNHVKESVAGFPLLKHLSIPMGLVVRSFPTANIMKSDALYDVMESDKYDALYSKTLDTHKGQKTRKAVPVVTGRRLTKKN